MKPTFSLSLALLLTLAPLSGRAATQSKPELIKLAPESVLVPTGFDDNDSTVEVVIAGRFRNTCFKVGPEPTWTLDAEKKTIFVSQSVTVQKDALCIQMLVPYFQVIKLGHVEAGRYSISVDDPARGAVELGALSVANSDNVGPDDFLYAPIEDAYVEQIDPVADPRDPRTIVLRGTFTNTCMALKQVRVIQNTPNVVEVLPIAELASADNCRDEKVPFEYRVQIPHRAEGLTLVHVRSLNGSAVNKVIDL